MRGERGGESGGIGLVTSNLSSGAGAGVEVEASAAVICPGVLFGVHLTKRVGLAFIVGGAVKRCGQGWLEQSCQRAPSSDR